jgi:hypothetical protein
MIKSLTKSCSQEGWLRDELFGLYRDSSPYYTSSFNNKFEKKSVQRSPVSATKKKWNFKSKSEKDQITE